MQHLSITQLHYAAVSASFWYLQWLHEKGGFLADLKFSGIGEKGEKSHCFATAPLVPANSRVFCLGGSAPRKRGSAPRGAALEVLTSQN